MSDHIGDSNELIWFKKYEKMKEENERLKKQFELDYCLEAEKCKLHGVAMENHALQAENAVLREQNILCIGEVGRLEKENAALRAEVAKQDLPCDGCKHLYPGGAKICLLSSNHCIRRAEDYFTTAKAKAAKEQTK